MIAKIRVGLRIKVDSKIEAGLISRLEESKVVEFNLLVVLLIFVIALLGVKSSSDLLKVMQLRKGFFK